jgi:hypothetical protein
MTIKDPITRMREELEVCGCNPDKCMTCQVPSKVETALDEIEAQYVGREELDVAEAAHRAKTLRVKELENNLTQANGARKHWKAKAEAACGELADLKAKVETQYMRLPVDKHGEVIRIGDRLVYEPVGIEGEVQALSDCWVSFGDSRFYGVLDCRHVKPDTLESLLQQLAEEVWEASCECQTTWSDSGLDGIAERYAERIRKAVEHEQG